MLKHWLNHLAKSENQVNSRFINFNWPVSLRSLMDLRMFVALRARFWAASKISLCRCRCSGLSLLLLLLLLLPTSMFIIVLVELISVWKYEKEVNHDLTSVYNGILLYWFSSTSGQCYKHFKGKSLFPQNYQAKNVFFCAF